MSVIPNAVRESAPKPEAPASLGLVAASVKNTLPRLIHNLPVAAILWLYVNPAAAMTWFAAVWAIMFAGVGVMGRIQAAGPGTPRARSLGYLLNGVNMVSGGLSADGSVALWFSGDPIAGAFAIVAIFISSSYVLLQYYSDPKIFTLYMIPYG